MEDFSFSSLAQNTAILLALVLIFDLSFDYLHVRRASLRRNAQMGVFIGILGVLVMRTPWVLAPGIVFDTRSILLGMAGLFFGGVPTLVGMGITIVYRFYLGGDGALTGSLVILAMGSLGLAWRAWRKSAPENAGWVEYYVFGIVLHLVMLGIMMTLPAGQGITVMRSIALPVLTIYPVGTALLGLLFRNRMRREGLIEEVIERERVFKIVADYTYDWEFWLDEKDRLVHCSPSCRDLTGYSAEELQNDPHLILKMIHADDLESYIRHHESLSEHGVLEYRIHKKDGTLIWIGHACTPVFDKDGILRGIRASNRNITQRKEAEEAMHAARRSADQIIQSIPSGIYLYEYSAPDRLVLRAGNPAAERLTGLHTESHLGKEHDEIWPAARDAGIKDAFLGVMHSGEHYITDEKPYDDGNVTGNYRIRAFPISERLLAVAFENVKPLRDTETEMKLSKRRLADVIEFLPDATIGIDRERRVIIWNQATEKMTGIPGRDMLGKGDHAYSIPFYGENRRQLMDLIWEDDVELREKYPNLTREGETLSAEVFCTALYGGRGAWVYTRATPLHDQDGNITGAIEIMRDITARKRAEEDMRRANEELERLFREAEDSRQVLLSVVEDQRTAEEQVRLLNAELEARVQERTAMLENANLELEAFSYSVSHDLRAPLRTLEGYSAILLEDYGAGLDDQGKHYLERIRAASRRMGDLIRDLLNLSRITRGEMKREQVDLSMLAWETILEIQTQKNARRIEFMVEPNMMAEGDRNLLRIAIDNLIQNACKYSSQREIAHVEFGVTRVDSGSAYFVRDDGAGFDMTYADKLFTPFMRLHKSDEYPGTGIGLVTVKRIVNRHGGKIWAQAEVDRGATFYFTLKS